MDKPKKPLQKWQGKGLGNRTNQNLAVSAYSWKQAKLLILQACQCRGSYNDKANNMHLKTHWSGGWPSRMNFEDTRATVYRITPEEIYKIQ